MSTSAAVGLAGRDQAGAAGDAVEVDRARAALALLAGVLGAGQAHPLAQDVEQALALPDVVGLAALAVDRDRDPHQAASSLVVGPGPAEAAPGHHGEGVPAVRRGAADVVDRRGRGGDQPPELRRRRRGPRRARVLPVQLGREERLGVGRPARGGRRRADAGADPLPLGVQGQAERGDRDHHRVAGADLAELLRAGGGADPDRGDQLVGAAGVLLDAGVELVRRHAAYPVERGELDLREGGEQRGVRVAGRGGGAEVAADRAAVADLRRPDGARGQRQAGQLDGRARRSRGCR